MRPGEGDEIWISNPNRIFHHRWAYELGGKRVCDSFAERILPPPFWWRQNLAVGEEEPHPFTQHIKETQHFIISTNKEKDWLHVFPMVIYKVLNPKTTSLFWDFLPRLNWSGGEVDAESTFQDSLHLMRCESYWLMCDKHMSSNIIRQCLGIFCQGA